MSLINFKKLVKQHIYALEVFENTKKKEAVL